MLKKLSHLYTGKFKFRDEQANEIISIILNLSGHMKVSIGSYINLLIGNIIDLYFTE